MLIPSSLGTGSRPKRIGVFGVYAVVCGVPGLVLAVGCLISGLGDPGNRTGLGFGLAFVSLAYGFGRMAYAAYRENSAHPVGDGSAKPWAVAMALVVLGLVAAYHGSPS